MHITVSLGKTFKAICHLKVKRSTNRSGPVRQRTEQFRIGVVRETLICLIEVNIFVMLKPNAALVRGCNTPTQLT